MTTLLGDARIRIRPDMTGAEKTITSGVGNAMKRAAGVAAAAFAASGVVSFLQDSVKAASDLNETQNKARVIFGRSARDIEKWAENAATSFGLSKTEALGAAASFGDMFLQLGYTRTEAAKTSKETVKLAADLGSFHNVDPSDVLQRISAAYRGEFDSLQALIPNINAARVETEALAISHKKSAKELTAQDKALAVNSILLKDGKNAANDFAETSDSLANRTRILNAQFEDSKAKLGEKLLPVLTRFANFVSKEAIPAIERLWQKIGPKLSDGMRVARAAGEDLWKSIQFAYKLIFPMLQGALDDIREAFRDNEDGSNGLKTALKFLWEVLKIVVQAAILVAGTFIKQIGGAFLATRRLLDNVLIPGFRYLVSFVLDAAEKILDGATFAFGWIPGIGPKLKGAQEQFKRFKDSVNNALSGIKPVKTIDVNVRLGGKNVAVKTNTKTGKVTISGAFGHAVLADGGILPGYTPGRDIYPAMLSGGEAVLRPEATRAIGADRINELNKAAKRGGIMGAQKVLAFADGGIVTNARAMGPITGRAARRAADKTMEQIARALASVDVASMAGYGAGFKGGVGGSGVTRWAPLVLQALAMLGQPSSWLSTVLRRMNQESGGNPRAINLWDSNAKAGIPSMGLMQTIGPTFNAYAGALRGRGVWDPLANIYAGLNYALNRYGSLAALNRPGGYSNGTTSARRGWNLVGERGPEWQYHKGGETILPNGQTPGGVLVQVFLGERELTDIVDVRITENNNKLADNLRRGRR